MLQSEFEKKGYFWIPENPEGQIPGVLNFSQKDGINLELFGHLEYDRKNKKESIIVLGFTSDGKKISMLNCFEYSRKNSVPGFPLSSLSAIYLLTGVHFNSLNDLEFSEMSISYEGINYWLGISGFERIEQNDEIDEVVVKYKKPEDKKFNIKDQWELNILFEYFSPLKYFQPKEKAEIRQSPQMVFKNIERKNFIEFWDIFQTFNSFLSVCYFSFPKVNSVEFFIKDEDYKKSKVVECYYQQGINYSKYAAHDNKHKFLVRFKEFSETADKKISEWFCLDEKISSAINILTEVFMERSEAMEYRFLGLTQALEGLHRKLNCGQQSFITRITEVINDLPPKIKMVLISNEEEFTETIRNNRNYLTHLDERLEDEAVSLDELFVLSEKMKIILIATLLKNIGFSHEEVEKIIIGKGVFLFNHIIGYDDVKEKFTDW